MQLKLVLACFSFDFFFVLKKFRVQISRIPNMMVSAAISNRNLRISTGLFFGAMFRWFGGATVSFLRDPNSVFTHLRSAATAGTSRQSAKSSWREEWTPGKAKWRSDKPFFLVVQRLKTRWDFDDGVGQ